MVDEWRIDENVLKNELKNGPVRVPREKSRGM
jgi:hypothetical protein